MADTDAPVEVSCVKPILPAALSVWLPALVMVPSERPAAEVRVSVVPVLTFASVMPPLVEVTEVDEPEPSVFQSMDAPDSVIAPVVVLIDAPVLARNAVRPALTCASTSPPVMAPAVEVADTDAPVEVNCVKPILPAAFTVMLPALVNDPSAIPDPDDTSSVVPVVAAPSNTDPVTSIEAAPAVVVNDAISTLPAPVIAMLPPVLLKLADCRRPSVSRFMSPASGEAMRWRLSMVSGSSAVPIDVTAFKVTAALALAVTRFVCPSPLPKMLFAPTLITLVTAPPGLNALES